MKPLPVVMADASFLRNLQRAGLAVCSREGLMVAAEVVSCRDAIEAEILAMSLACSYMAARRFPAGSILLSDAEQAIRHVSRGWKRKYERAPEVHKMLADHGWTVKWVPRHSTRHADSVARKVLKAWRLGAEGRPTWSPAPYVKQVAQV